MSKITYLDVCPLWRCNAKCPTCDAWKRDPKLELSLMQAEQILLEPKFRHLRRLVIEGGEPTFWPHLRWFVEQMYFINKKIIISIITNGIAVTKIKELAARFEPIKERLRWYVSLNGLNEIHDMSRGVPGAYNKTLNSAKALKRYGHIVHFSYTPFKQNIKDYSKVTALGKIYDIPLSVCFPTSRAKFSDGWDLADRKDLDDLNADWLSRCSFRKKVAYTYFLNKVRNQKLMPCNAGKSMLHINPKGIIHACHMTDQYPLGGITKKEVVWFKPYISGIPSECQYKDGEFCVDCYAFATINKRRNVPKMLWSNLWSNLCRK